MTEAIYRQHAPFVAGFLAKLGVSSRYIDDEVIRIFGEVHRHAEGAPGAASTKAWVAAVAFRRAASRYRLTHVALGAPGADGWREPSIDEFVHSLEPELRAIFLLFELEGEPSESIASAFGLSLEGVHTRLHEGQREFRRAFGLCDASVSVPSAGGESDRPLTAPAVDDEGLGLAAFVDPVSLL